MSFRHALLAFRCVLLLAVGAMFASAPEAFGPKVTLLAVLAVSTVLLIFLPDRVWRHRNFLAGVVVFDLAVFSLVLYWAGETGIDFYLAYFLLLPVVAVAGSLVWVSLASAAIVIGYALLLYLQEGVELLQASDLLGRFPFLFVVGISYGLLANRARQLENEARKLRQLNHWLSRLTHSFTGTPQQALSLIRGVLDDLHDSFPGVVRASLVRMEGSSAEVLLSSDDPELDSLALDLTKYPELVEATRQGSPLAIEDVQQSPVTAAVREHLQDAPFRSLLLCPVDVDRQTVGYLLLRVAGTERGFSSEEREFCDQLSRSIAAVFRHALLQAAVDDASHEVRLHRVVVDNLPIAICVWRLADDGGSDPRLRLVATNSTAGRMLDMGAAAEGMTLEDCLEGMDTARLAEACEEALSSGRARDVGDLRHGAAVLSVKAFPLVEGYVGMSFEDITSRRRAQEELRQSQDQLRQTQKMEAIGRLAGSVAHDFNNLLTAIGGYAALTLESLSSGHPAREDVQEIVRATDRATALTRQLLAFSRKQVLKPAPVEINGVLSEVDKLLERLLGEDVELVIELGDGVGLIEADVVQLEQVVMNLAINARDAMPGGGRLRIGTCARRYDEPVEVVDGTAGPGSYVALEVSDDGVGMSPEVQQQIFEPFFTTKDASKGTGLGLSTVYGIVRQSGGFIRLHSEEGRGTTFEILLPCLPEEGEGAEAGPAAKEPEDRGSAPRRPTVLIVDDEAPLLELTSRMLRGSGYEVLGADSPAAATSLCSEYDGEIDLLLTDVMLPEVDGVTLARRLADVRPGMRILFMSGYSDDDLVEQLVKDQSRSFLQKPFTREGLVGNVEMVLHGR